MPPRKHLTAPPSVSCSPHSARFGVVQRPRPQQPLLRGGEMTSFKSVDDSVSGSGSATSSTTGTTPVTPIAVIGMACRLPGGIDSRSNCGSVLRGDDLIMETAPDRWDAEEYYDPNREYPVDRV